MVSTGSIEFNSNKTDVVLALIVLAGGRGRLMEAIVVLVSAGIETCGTLRGV